MKTIIVLVTALMVTGGMAQDKPFQELPGFVDIHNILSEKEGELTTEIEIKNPLLSMVARMSEAKDDDLANLLSGLELIKVYKFKIDQENIPDIKEKLLNLDVEMKKQQWDQFVKIREKDQFSNIYLQTIDDAINGLTVFTIDGDETILINIVGNIDLTLIGKMGKKFDIPELDTLETQK